MHSSPFVETAIHLADIRTVLDPIARPAPPVVGRKPSLKAQKPALQQCRAIWAYMAMEADELNFNENDRIEIVEEVDAAWWRGSVIRPDGSRSEAHLFPSNYVEKVAPSTTPSLSPLPPRRNVPPIYTPSSTTSEQPSSYFNDTNNQPIPSLHSNFDSSNNNSNNQIVQMPSPYGGQQQPTSPNKWYSPSSAPWSKGKPPTMPPPPPSNNYISPVPSHQSLQEKPSLSPAPNNQSYYQHSQNQSQSDIQAPAVMGPSNPALYGTQQPVDDHHKREKVRFFTFLLLRLHMICSSFLPVISLRQNNLAKKWAVLWPILSLEESDSWVSPIFQISTRPKLTSKFSFPIGCWVSFVQLVFYTPLFFHFWPLL